MSPDTEKEIAFDWRAFTPDDSPKTPIDLLADPRARDLSTPKLKEGDLAYDFTLPLHDFSDGVEKATGDAFHLLHAAQDRPVALIFGSYT